jgi:ribosomal protein S18 acetylase RimI-like enzyme
VSGDGTFTLRPERADDADFLRRLYGSTREPELALTDWPADRRAAFVAMQHDARERAYRARHPDARRSVVVVDAVPVGRLMVAFLDDAVSVVDVAIEPAHRGRGLGTALLRTVLDEARALRLSVRVHVARESPARRLYERLGFVLVEELGLHDLLERPVDR